MTIQELIGHRIKNLREKNKLSQTELANLVGYKAKTAIAKVEAGKVDLPQSKIWAFANALHTDVSYFFDGNSVNYGDFNSPQQPTMDFLLSNDEKELILKYRKISSEDKEMINRILAYSSKLSTKNKS